MAKALTGHLRTGSGVDARMASELVRLRARVRELESELARRELPESMVVAEPDLRGCDDDRAPEQFVRLDCATPAWR